MKHGHPVYICDPIWHYSYRNFFSRPHADKIIKGCWSVFFLPWKYYFSGFSVVESRDFAGTSWSIRKNLDFFSPPRDVSSVSYQDSFGQCVSPQWVKLYFEQNRKSSKSLVHLRTYIFRVFWFPVLNVQKYKNMERIKCRSYAESWSVSSSHYHIFSAPFFW